MQRTSPEPLDFLNPSPGFSQRISAVPLEFEYLPVQIIAKEFTKLNSNHEFRVHYLGPRPQDTLAVHKKYGRQHRAEDDHCRKWEKQEKGQVHTPGGCRYGVDFKGLSNCSFAGRQDSQFKTTLFYRAFEGMNPTLHPNEEFIFNGAFEGGNLDCVIKVSPDEFDLFLRIDSNTRGHTGWYFFSIANGSRKQEITINIGNLRKPSPLYAQGMRPYVFSRKAFEKRGLQWSQGCTNCRCEQALLRYSLIYERVSLPILYRLTFSYQFQYQDDEVYFAYCVPYTYSQLQQDIESFRHSPHLKVLSVGRSLSGLDIPLLHVTEYGSHGKKKGIVVTGRVHPGETNGSHMVKGLIEVLLGESKQAQQFRRQNHVFIVPMVNPDGVVLGNTRTSAAGKDLNREFIEPQVALFPQVDRLKGLVSKLQRRIGVILYLDFHGHSRRKNTFFYGPSYPIQNPQYYKCRLLPKIIEKIDASFRYHSCHFMISEEKKSTARAVMCQQFNIPFVYTVESSLGLFYHPESMKTLPFRRELWLDMGTNIFRGICTFISVLEEYEQLGKEKRAERQKKKKRSITASGSRANRKAAEDEVEMLISRKAKEGATSLCCQLLREIRTISLATSNLTKQVEEEDVDSDDHDEEEDLPSSKMKDFKNMMVRSKAQSTAFKTKQVSEDIQLIVPHIREMSKQKSSGGLKKTQNKIKKHSVKEMKDSRLFKHKPTHRVTKTIELEVSPGSKRPQNIINSRNSIHSIGSTTFHAESRQIFKQALSVPKQRYSLATKNLFPVESREEVISLPKSLQIMRKEMKKGRILISNLEESRLKFMNFRQEREEKRERKGPFLPVDPAKARMAARSSTSHIAFNLGVSGKDEIRYCLGSTQQDAYQPLEGIEVDNMAMTIKTFKRG